MCIRQSGGREIGKGLRPEKSKKNIARALVYDQLPGRQGSKSGSRIRESWLVVTLTIINNN